MILRCTCKHDFQDQKYGFGMRVHNSKQGKGVKDSYNCTVCGNNKSKEESKKIGK